jgi:hypothetical protein
MAAGAIGIKNMAAHSLGGIESKLRVGLSGLDMAAHRRQREQAERWKHNAANEAENRAHHKLSWLKSGTILSQWPFCSSPYGKLPHRRTARAYSWIAVAQPASPGKR